MALSGVGTITGLRTVFQLDSAIIMDSARVFDYVKKSLESPQQEKSGAPGFRAVAGDFMGKKIALVQVPPYPQAAVEAATELYLLGARKIIIVARAYRLTRRVPQNAVLIVNGAVGADSVSWRIVRQGVPLLAAAPLLAKARNIIEVRFPDVEWHTGFTVTVDSPRLKYTVADAEEYSGYKGVAAVESLVAPVYALQYEYSNLEVMALATLARQFSRVPQTIEPSEDTASRLAEREARTASLLVTMALEILGHNGKG